MAFKIMSHLKSKNSALITKLVYFIANIKIINSFNASPWILMLLTITLSASNYAISSITPLPPDTTSDLLLAEFAANNNNPSKALEIYQKLSKQSKDPKILKRAAELAIALTDREKTIETVTLWADNDKQAIKAQLAASLLYTQLGEINKTHNYLKQLFLLSDEASFHNIELLFTQQFEPAKLEEFGQLLEQINTELKDSPKLFISTMALALYYEKTDQKTDQKINASNKSIEHINKVLSMKPDWTHAHMQKTKLLSMYESADKAIKYLDNIIALHPNQHELRKLYADILYDMEQFEKAEEHYVILSKQSLFESEALLQLAHINLAKNDLKTAEKYLLKLTTQPTYNSLAKYYLGIVAEQLGNQAKALEYFSHIESEDYAIRGQVRGVAILTLQKKSTEAAKMMQDIYNSESADIKTNVLAEAQLLYEQGLHQNALIVLKNLEAKYPEDIDIKYSLGILAKKMNDNDLFEKNMGFVLKKNPDNASALSALGWHYFSQKKTDQALTLLKQAFAHDDSNTTSVGARLGAVLWSTGQYDQANVIWKKMLELDPYNEALRDIIKKYKK